MQPMPLAAETERLFEEQQRSSGQAQISQGATGARSEDAVMRVLARSCPSGRCSRSPHRSRQEARVQCLPGLER